MKLKKSQLNKENLRRYIFVKHINQWYNIYTMNREYTK